MNKLPSMIIVSEFAPWWLAAWRLANWIGATAFRKFLEDRPSFTPSSKYRYVTRSRTLKNGEIDFGLYSTPSGEVPKGWPDTPTKI